MIEFYFIGLLMTAVYELRIARPRGAGEWLGFSALAICWPLLVAFTAYCVIHNTLKSE